MIELAFGESAAGALKFAKSMKRGQRAACAVGIIGGTAKERREIKRQCGVKKPREWTGADMEGGSRDVAALTLALDIGDISDTEGQGRKAALETLFSIYPGVADAIWETNLSAFGRLRGARETLEPVRMWYCGCNAAELCGVYFMCRFMEGAKTPLSVVRLPEEEERDGAVISRRSMGEVSAEELGAMAGSEMPLSDVLRGVYANSWKSLAQENAPLRAIVNGSLIGVPADFYDFALRSCMPQGEFAVARLIGKTLALTPGIADRWLHIRILDMIEAGELELVSEGGDHAYSAVVKRKD